jgi:hypothetical protein
MYRNKFLDDIRPITRKCFVFRPVIAFSKTFIFLEFVRHCLLVADKEYIIIIVIIILNAVSSSFTTLTTLEAVLRT